MKTAKIYISLVITLLVFGSCTHHENDQQKVENILVLEDTAILENQDEAIYWGLTNYFDTILKYKEIAKFRLQQATWSAILIKETKDSLFSYGSIYQGKVPKTEGDTLGLIDYRFLVIRENENLLLIDTDKEYNEGIKYTLRKRNELSELIIQNKKNEAIEDSVEALFNREILSGTYLDLKSRDTLVFSKDGGIKGGQDSSYIIRGYFGTLHPYNNLDVVYFNRDYEGWNWKIKDDILHLRKFDTMIHDQILLTKERRTYRKLK